MNLTKKSCLTSTAGVVILALVAGFVGGFAGAVTWPVVQPLIFNPLRATVVVAATDRYATIPQSRDAAGDHLLGSPTAPVTITEYSDFQCPFCTRFHEQTWGDIIERDIAAGRVNFVYRDLPLPFHAEAHLASEATECAADQQKFWQFHDALFVNEAVWADNKDAIDVFVMIADKLDLDTRDFRTCLTSDAKRAEVDEDNAAATALGLTGTPSFIIGAEKIEGAYPYAAFAEAITKTLDAKKAAATAAKK